MAEQTDIQSDGQSLQARAMASGQAARSAQRELEESGKSKKSRLPLIVVICSLAVGLLVIGVWQIGRSKQSSVDNNMAKVTRTPAKQTAAAATPEPVVYKMENVIGMKKKSAAGSIDQIGCKGIKVTWKEKYSSETSRGKVINQSIDPGTEIKEDEAVSLVLVVSKGVQRFTVPKVVGNSESQARQKLKKAKMQISVAREYSSSYSSGKVIRQSVAAGKKVTKGKAVTITVSRGAKPVTHTTTNSGSSTRRSTSSSGSSSGSSSKTTPKKVLPPM